VRADVKQIPRTTPHDQHSPEYFNPNNILNKWFVAPAILIPTNVYGNAGESWLNVNGY